jgi:hypothetical protein
MGMACSWSSNRPGKNSGVGNIGSKLQVFPVGSTPKSSPPGVPVFHWVEASGHRVATCSDCFDIACGWRSPLIGCRSHFVRDCRQSILKRCDLHEDGPDLPGRWTSWCRNFRQLQQRVGGSREAVFDRRSGRPIQASVWFFLFVDSRDLALARLLESRAAHDSNTRASVSNGKGHAVVLLVHRCFRTSNPQVSFHHK